MENATKALLIAAAVLVVIVVIALGVRLLGAGADVSDQADAVSTELSGKITEKTGELQTDLSGI